MNNALPNTPAKRLIATFGVKTLADWTGRHVSRVHAWTWPLSRGGTGGVVPVRLRERVMEGALRDRGVQLTHADFEPADGEVYAFDRVAA